MGGRGASSSGANKRGAGIALLQGELKKASTSQLENTYKLLGKKQMQNMSNEEKMVLATVTDELFDRNRLVWDRKTEEYSFAPKNAKIKNYNGTSYKINGYGTVTNFEGKEVKFAKASFLLGGEWHEVVNWNTRINLAKSNRKMG